MRRALARTVALVLLAGGYGARHYPGDACDAHPTAEQHEAMARDLEPVLREALGW